MSKTYDWFVTAMLAHANGYAALFGGPCFLVGSALAKAEPGDWDVRCVIDSDDMLRLRGKDGWGVLRIQLKQSRRLARELGVNVDFQLQYIKFALQEKYAALPSVRLDGAPMGFFDAGRSDA